MDPQTIDFEITDARGRQHQLGVLNVEGGRWVVQACIDGRVFTHRYRNWQAVERTIRRLHARRTAIPPRIDQKIPEVRCERRDH